MTTSRRMCQLMVRSRQWSSVTGARWPAVTPQALVDSASVQVCTSCCCCCHYQQHHHHCHHNWQNLDYHIRCDLLHSLHHDCCQYHHATTRDRHHQHCHYHHEHVSAFGHSSLTLLFASGAPVHTAVTHHSVKHALYDSQIWSFCLFSRSALLCRHDCIKLKLYHCVLLSLSKLVQNAYCITRNPGFSLFESMQQPADKATPASLGG